MNDPFVIEVDAADAQAWFGKLIDRGTHLGGLMESISNLLHVSTTRRFHDGVGPDGVAWVPLKAGSGRTPLNDSGRMREQITPSSGEDWAEISATAKQARYHQFGTDPYEILAKPGKALSWPGLPTRTNKAGQTVPGAVKKVNHPGLPARPFIGLSEDDRNAITALAASWVSLQQE